MATRAATATAQLKFRVQERLRAKLEEAAKAHAMTLNAEIVRRLEESFDLDQKRRELEIEREYVRNANKEFSARETKYQERISQLTDVLLQITSKDMVLVRKDQVNE